MDPVEWLEPWSAVDAEDRDYCGGFERQLALEVRRGHPLYGLSVHLIGRGNGDDCLFSLEDGSRRVAVVHLVWQGPQKPPWPSSAVYADLEAWVKECMIPEHQDWTDG